MNIIINTLKYLWVGIMLEFFPTHVVWNFWKFSPHTIKILWILCEFCGNFNKWIAGSLDDRIIIRVLHAYMLLSLLIINSQIFRTEKMIICTKVLIKIKRQFLLITWDVVSSNNSYHRIDLYWSPRRNIRGRKFCHVIGPIGIKRGDQRWPSHTAFQSMRGTVAKMCLNVTRNWYR